MKHEWTTDKPMNFQKHSVRKEVERSGETGGYSAMILGHILSRQESMTNVIENMDAEGFSKWIRKGTQSNKTGAEGCQSERRDIP